jgi:hypothetical protein
MAITKMDIVYAQDSSKTVQEQKQNRVEQTKIENDQHFIDEDGDGYNDNAPDHDGDGIPNGLDPDYQKLKQQRKGMKYKFVDLDGDGINDNFQEEEQQTMQDQSKMSDQEKNSSLDQNNQQGSGKGKRYKGSGK